MLYGLKLYIFSNYQLITFGGTHVVFLKCCNGPNTKCLITSKNYHEKLRLPKSLKKKEYTIGTIVYDMGIYGIVYLP